MTNQEFIKQFCKVEDRETMMVTVDRNPEKVTCCTCGYSKEKEYGRGIEEYD